MPGGRKRAWHRVFLREKARRGPLLDNSKPEGLGNVQTEQEEEKLGEKRENKSLLSRGSTKESGIDVS